MRAYAAVSWVMGEQTHEALELRIAACREQGALTDGATLAIRGFGPEILGYLVGLCASEDAGHEIFADFSERLWRTLPNFRGECSFRVWCYRRARSAAFDHLKRAHRHRERPIESHELSAVAQEVVSSVTHQRSAVLEKWSRLRAQLDPEEQTLLILRLDRGLSWPELAAVMSEDAPVEAAALRKRFERLKRRLRDALRSDGGL